MKIDGVYPAAGFGTKDTINKGDKLLLSQDHLRQFITLPLLVYSQHHFSYARKGAGVW